MESFTDYLKSDFKERKLRNPNYSLRSYANFLGESPSLLSKAFNSQIPVTPKKIFKLSKKLNLPETEICKYLIFNLKADYQLSLESKEKNEV
ncbi:MAG: helix-turn-helix domain-containing protein [Bdellovibrionales bacterium]